MSPAESERRIPEGTSQALKRRNPRAQGRDSCVAKYRWRALGRRAAGWAGQWRLPGVCWARAVGREGPGAAAVRRGARARQR